MGKIPDPILQVTKSWMGSGNEVGAINHKVTSNHARLSYEGIVQGWYHWRILYKGGIIRGYRTRVSYEGIVQGYRTRVSYKAEMSTHSFSCCLDMNKSQSRWDNWCLCTHVQISTVCTQGEWFTLRNSNWFTKLFYFSSESGVPAGIYVHTW